MVDQRKIRVILADDHQLFRDGVVSLLSDAGQVEVVAAVSSGNELLESLESVQVDVALVDVALGEMSGIEATRLIGEMFPDVRVLILSMHNSEEFVQKAIQAGARGYLPKDTDKEVLLKAISDIYLGHMYFDPHIAGMLVNSLIKTNENKKAAESKMDLLTSRELEVVQLVAEGYINKEIADKLHISVRTVDSHKNNIINKLKLKTSVDIVKFAIKNGLIKL
ncbi:MAG: response regulator transcription factor [Bacteroidales bacterium]|nr:response regulator transcription factor [Bacteroidales bacterium]